MSVEIKESHDNKLLGRREVSAEITFDAATPKRADLKQEICGKLGLNPELAIIHQTSTNFGEKIAKVVLHIYTDKDVLMKTEPKHIKVREGLEQKAEKKKKAKATPAKKK